MRNTLLGLLAGTAALAIAASAAQAADLPSRAAPAPVMAAVPIFSWTGFYVGVNAGYGWNTNDNNSYYDATLGIYGNGSDSDGGFIGGGQIGYNYQIGQFVIGVETDIQYADIGGKSNNYYAGYYYGNKDSDGYFGTVRARLGFAIDRALVYATGGFAYGDIAQGSSSLYGPGLYYYGNSSDTNTGWTLGGGVEYAFTNNLTGKIEGLYVSLDTKNNYTGYYADSNNAEFGVIRAGLNYKFSSY